MGLSLLSEGKERSGRSLAAFKGSGQRRKVRTKYSCQAAPLGWREMAPEAGMLFPPTPCSKSLELLLKNVPERRLQTAGTGPLQIGGT